MTDIDKQIDEILKAWSTLQRTNRNGVISNFINDAPPVEQIREQIKEVFRKNSLERQDIKDRSFNTPHLDKMLESNK